jgi:spermidine/putrescine transport system substrate-binding protein
MPRESFESAIERAIAQQRMSRRGFVGRAGSAMLGASALGAFLSACGGAEGQNEGGEAGGRTAEQVRHPETPIRDIVVANWPLYIDKAVIRDFEREFEGANLTYNEEINDNTEFFGKVRQPLEQGRSIGRDVVVLTDWMAGRWIRLDYTEPIDDRNVPNKSNLRANLRDVPFDQGRRHSLPWQSGMTGIGYDKNQVGEVRSMEQLFDAANKGKVTVLTEARDAIGLVMRMQGKDPAGGNIDEILEAVEFLERQNNDGQIRKFTGNEYTQDLARGNVALAMAWSGDMIQLKADNPNLEFVIPEEGGMLWSDNMLMPAQVEQPYAAEVFMNYVYDPQVAAKIAEYVNFVTPVEGAQEVLAETEPEIAEDELIFPGQETLDQLSVFADLDVETEQRMNEAFQAVVGG